MKRRLWLLAGSKLTKEGARSWISAPSKHRPVGWFIMRHTKKRTLSGSKVMRTGVWPGGYWAFMGARWDLQFFWSFTTRPDA